MPPGHDNAHPPIVILSEAKNPGKTGLSVFSLGRSTENLRSAQGDISSAGFASLREICFGQTEKS